VEISIAVVVVTKSRLFFQTGVNVINDIRSDVFHCVFVDADWPAEQERLVDDPVYAEAREKAIHFLSKRKDRLTLLVVQSSTLERAAEKLIALRSRTEGGFQVGMAYVDFSDPECQSMSIDDIDNLLVDFYNLLGDASIPAFQSSFSTVVFLGPGRRRIQYHPMNYIKCMMPNDQGVLQTRLLCLWMDFFEMSYTNQRVRPGVTRQQKSALAETLATFLTERAGSDWLTFYYTGSVVSNLINAFETCARNVGALVLRGPNEHSLACGAMANWQLYNKPFVTIVTSGMIDEFKGTLANLRESRAKGFIICAEQRLNSWFAFQATVTPDEDSRDVVKARRLPCVYMDDPNRFAEDLETAMTLYDAGEGPVVLLATRAVMDMPGPVDVRLPPVQNAAGPFATIESEPPELNAVMEILDSGPDKVLWQCGPFAEDELDLVLDIADRSGVALADSLAYPGSIPKFRNGVRNPSYLGTLSVYAFSERVYRFLHTEGRINSSSEQSLFFIKSKISQIATPFSEARLGRRFQITQVTHNPHHIAPFTDHPIVMDSRAFLQAVDRRLRTDAALRERRLAAMAAVSDTPSDVLSKLPAEPMSPNYFFHQLSRLVERLIAENDYDYTGVYDVGRCGISAVRNVARTRRGFSGWYGRALMGDALLSTLSLVHTCPTDLIAFVGDGARAMVPDMLPSVAENLLAQAPLGNKTITVFTFFNGGLSAINTYQELILFNRTSRQMRLVNIAADDWEENICGLKVVSRTLDVFDPHLLKHALLERGRLNFFTVNLSHNNEGDGLSLASASGWQRDRAADHRATPPLRADATAARTFGLAGEIAR
jgi:thiamine pyrophosphate-dependent acetolactate synthase large subunit-like protein